MNNESVLLNEVGLRLSQIRKKLGLTQTEFGSRLNVSPATISGVENGGTPPSFEIIYNLVNKLDVNIYYFLNGEPPMFKAEKLSAIFTGDLGIEQDMFLRDLFRYFKQSELARFSVMAFFKRFKIENKRLLEAELREDKTLDRKKSRIKRSSMK